MWMTVRVIAIRSATALILLLAGGPLQGQEPKHELELRAGTALPAGGLDEFGNRHVQLEVAFARQVNPRWSLRFEFGLANVAGNDADPRFAGFDLGLWTYLVGIDYSLLSRSGPIDLAVGAGIGATTVDSDPLARFEARDPSDPDFLEGWESTYPSLRLGARIGLDVWRAVGLVIAGDWRLALADPDDTRLLRAASEGEFGAFETLHTFPISAGLRFRF